eukprot:276154_1
MSHSQKQSLCTKCGLKKSIVIDSFVPGDIVIVNGLQNKREWNQRKAMVMQYVAAKDRYAVKISCNRLKKNALLKAENLTFVSKQKYINKLQGKIVTQQSDDNDCTQFIWKIPKKQLAVYNTFSKDCGYFSPIFEYKGLTFIFQLIPNGLCGINAKWVSCYKYENGYLNLSKLDNEGHCSLILTMLSMPFNTKQVALEYSVQFNSISNTYRSYNQTFHNEKRQSIWQRITTTETLKSLEKLTITATFKSFSKKMNNILQHIKIFKDPFHFSWNLRTKQFLQTVPCKTHNMQDVRGPIWQHNIDNNDWQWRAQLIRMINHEQIMLILGLLHFPQHIQSVNVIAVIRCSQLNMGVVLCHTYNRNDKCLATGATFCDQLFFRNNKNKISTFECILNVIDCTDINYKPASKWTGVGLIIASWIKKTVRNQDFDFNFIQTMIKQYIEIPKDIVNRIMNFQNDDKLKGLLNVYPNTKCINVKLLDTEESKPFRTKMCNMYCAKNEKIEQFWLATLEDITTSHLPFLERKRTSQIIWGIRTADNKLNLMLEMGQLDFQYFMTVSTTDCIQYQMMKDTDWVSACLSISNFMPQRRNRDCEKTFSSLFNLQKSKDKSQETGTQRPVAYRVWNAAIMQYEDFNVTEAIQQDDYWDIVDKQLEGIYIKICTTKLFEPRRR